MPTYTFVQFGQSQADLAARLYDTTMQQWTAAELGIYITEALRTWNALTSSQRGDLTINTVVAQTWYDLTQVAGTLRPFTVTDQYIQQTIEYHLLEPLVSYPGSWTGSSQFALSDIIGAFNRRQAEILADTACTLGVSLITAPTNTARITLADTVLSLRRVAWIPTLLSGYTNTILTQEDVWEKVAFDPLYNGNLGVPGVWMQSTDPANTFDVDYTPINTGQYELVTANSPTLSTGSSPVTLSVPDDWSWVLKWGTMIDLFGGEAERKDPRAIYCMKRYREALTMMADSPVVLATQLSGNFIQTDSVDNGDRFNPFWEAQSTNAPKSIYLTGMNLLALSPPSDLNNIPILITMIQNQPVPSSSGDYLQISRNDYDSLLDYAQHLAMVKLGGQEFMATLPLLQNFFRRATLYNRKLQGMGEFQPPTYEISGLDGSTNPTFVSKGQGLKEAENG